MRCLLEGQVAVFAFWGLLALSGTPSSSCCWAFFAPSTTTTILVERSSARTHQQPPRQYTNIYALPKDYQEQGNELIYKAARLCGASEENVAIEWKPGRVVVQVSGDSVYVAAPLEEREAAVLAVEEYDDDDDDDETTLPPNGIDVSAVARAINAAMDDEDGVGSEIAATHEIEVTTPGSGDELTGQIMFDAYKGFGVIVQHQDPKTNKTKTIEGSLVERNAEFTVINIKGRMKKLKNADVVSVKLPRAKKEKGSRR